MVYKVFGKKINVIIAQKAPGLKLITVNAPIHATSYFGRPEESGKGEAGGQSEVNLWHLVTMPPKMTPRFRLNLMTLALRFEPSGRQEQQVSCWNLAAKSQIVIQQAEPFEVCLRNPRPLLDIVHLMEQQYRNNYRILDCRGLYIRGQGFVKVWGGVSQVEPLYGGSPLLSLSRTESPGKGQYKLRGLKFSREISTKVELRTIPSRNSEQYWFRDILGTVWTCSLKAPVPAGVSFWMRSLSSDAISHLMKMLSISRTSFRTYFTPRGKLDCRRRFNVTAVEWEMQGVGGLYCIYQYYIVPRNQELRSRHLQRPQGSRRRLRSYLSIVWRIDTDVQVFETKSAVKYLVVMFMNVGRPDARVGHAIRIPVRLLHMVGHSTSSVCYKQKMAKRWPDTVEALLLASVGTFLKYFRKQSRDNDACEVGF
ncbi:hypothetical protein J6590_064700 [Homalodisca vitripennis]|nr:hypothetical protein J6590_064700 [Homalodisca vitripennis]